MIGRLCCCYVAIYKVYNKQYVMAHSFCSKLQKKVVNMCIVWRYYMKWIFKKSLKCKSTATTKVSTWKNGRWTWRTKLEARGLIFFNSYLTRLNSNIYLFSLFIFCIFWRSNQTNQIRVETESRRFETTGRIFLWMYASGFDVIAKIC